MSNNKQKQMLEEETKLSKKEICRILWSHKLILLTVVAFFSAAALVGSKSFVVPKYTSVTGIYVQEKNASKATSVFSFGSGDKLTADYEELVKSRPVLEDTIKKVGLLNITVENLRKNVSVTTPGNTKILYIEVSNEDPKLAQTIADTLRKEAVLKIGEVMDVKEVNVVETADLPNTPSSPDLIQNTMLGGIAGFIFASILLVVLARRDNTIKTPEDIENLLGLTVLATIPMAEAVKEPKKNKAKSSARLKPAKQGL